MKTIEITLKVVFQVDTAAEAKHKDLESLAEQTAAIISSGINRDVGNRLWDLGVFVDCRAKKIEQREILFLSD